MTGHKETRIYNNPYYDQPFKVRSLFSFELDEIYDRALSGCSKKTQDFIIKYKIMQEELKLEKFEPDLDLIELQHYFDSLDYLVSWYGCKDFQNEQMTFKEFTHTIKGVHEMAKSILSISTVPIIQIMEFIMSPKGKELCRTLYQFNIPLAEEISKLTHIQRMFLTLAPSPRSEASSLSHDSKDQEVITAVNNPKEFIDNWNSNLKSMRGEKNLTPPPVGVKAPRDKVFGGKKDAGGFERPSSGSPPEHQ